MLVRKTIPLGPATLTLETGRLAKQADGSVLVQQGDTMVLATAVIGGATKEGSGDFVPLTVDYREKSYAAGKIPGGFFKREGRPTEKEILTARLIDRPIRSLCPKGLRHEIQIITQVLSSDGAYDPDILAVVGGSVAMGLSQLKLHQPLSAVRVGRVNGTLAVNPTYAELATSPLDVVVAGTREGIVMIEAGANEVSEQEMFEAIAFGYAQVRTLIDGQEQLIKQAGKQKQDVSVATVDPELLARVRDAASAELSRINQLPEKEQREQGREELVQRLVTELSTQQSACAAPGTSPGSAAGRPAWTAGAIGHALYDVELGLVRHMILDEHRRPDGRDFTAIRSITCEVGVLPRTHGSGLFTRGQTQSLAVTTLGTSQDEQMIEALEGETYKNFMLHYNFPPFSVGEVKRVGSPGRREIGHGALAERSLKPVMPTKEVFPYTVRVVSDILESNGSSSMATVCAGTLALMDAGVPITAPVSGIAMGLVSDGKRHAILTDIAGLEDHYGDMDFKVAGTKHGITALQLDVRLPHGLTLPLIEQTLAQANAARLIIMDHMMRVLEKPRPAISVYAPRITVIHINPERIRDVIGPGGKVIRKIIEQTGAEINVEDDGSVSVASSDSKAADRAIQIIKELTEDVAVGRVYKGKVKRIMNFGAFCEILPGKEGLIHVSELDYKYVKRVEDVVNLGDELDVKVIEVDEQGRINLSRKALLPPPPPEELREAREAQEREGERPRGPQRGGPRHRSEVRQ